MTQHQTLSLRSGIAAIAAAAVLSSTSLMAAQSTTPTPDSTSPPASPSSPSPSVAEPPAAPLDTQSSTDPAADTNAAPAPAKPRLAKRTSVSRTAKPARVAAAPAATPKAKPVATSSAPAAAVAPLATPPVVPKVVVNASPPAAPPAPAKPAPSLTDRIEAELANDPLPFGAAGAAGLMALIGGVALSRRRRRRLEEETAAWDHDWTEAAQEEPTAPVTVPQPAESELTLTEPVAASPAGSGNRLPNGFDLSRFGPHVQAAYRGPTPDNPSLSLRHRLRRGAALDQRRRQAAAGRRDAPRPSATVPAAPAPNGFAVQGDGQFLFQRVMSKPATEKTEAG